MSAIRGSRVRSTRLLRAVLVGSITATLFVVGPAAPTPARATHRPQIVIGEIYVSGGEAGAFYANDYVEIFDQHAYADGFSLYYAPYRGAPWTQIAGGTAFPFSTLIKLGSSGSEGGTLPTADHEGSMNLSSTGGALALMPQGAPAPFEGYPYWYPGLEEPLDVVGWGDYAGAEGLRAVAPLDPTKAALRAEGGCVDTDRNRDDFFLDAPRPTNSTAPSGLPCPPRLNVGFQRGFGAGTKAVSTDGSIDCPEVNCSIMVEAGTVVTLSVFADEEELWYPRDWSGCDSYEEVSWTEVRCTVTVGAGATKVTAHSYPPEYCNGYDDDYDGLRDEEGPHVTWIWYARDADGDGYARAGTGDVLESCDPESVPSGYVPADNGGDRDDNDPTVYPGAPELCDQNDVDEDGDELADDADSAAEGKTLWYLDADGDGFGAETDPGTLACDAPMGMVSNNSDPDDTDPNVVPVDPSTLTLGVTKTAEKIKVAGTLEPAHPGADVVVKLQRRRDGNWRLLASKTVSLDELSRYSARFARPEKRGRYRVVATFPGDNDHSNSSARRTFDL